jgi:phosphopantothenoylcysteine decarboxylase/phosphopantothenate--cysteine ligase
MAPAMDGGMWDHPAVGANVALLRQRGVTVLEPESGPLASVLSGKGRLPEIDTILAALRQVLSPIRDLAGDRIVVTAGPTREPIDPVRYISNRSSGKMGYRLAAAAIRRGAAVTLVSGPTSQPPPAGAAFVPVETAEEMREAVLQHSGSATIVIKAAAVADYRVKAPATTKIKGKRDLTLDLIPNPDILKEVAAAGTGAFIVGFAAETHDVVANAQAKSRARVSTGGQPVSQAGNGFDAEDNEVPCSTAGAGGAGQVPKSEVADAIPSHALALRATAPAPLLP